MELIELVPFVVLGVFALCSVFAGLSLLGEHLGRVSRCYPLADPDSTPGEAHGAAGARPLR